ncbi:MAG: hypothetical protein R6X02_13295 [Enhygromyxa sp.]
MRASSLLVTCSLFVLACADPASGEPTPRSSRSGPEAGGGPELAEAQPVEESPAPASVVAEPEPSSAAEEPSVELPAAEAEAEAEPAPSELEAEAAPADPLAPILPSGPEPGSPEAAAELAELLEESTLTQEEFDAAFRKNKPKIAGDQFVFGPGDRTRKRPVVGLGTPKIKGSTIAAAELTELAKAHERGFEGCLAVALVDKPELSTSVTLKVGFDAKGEVDEAKIEGGAAGAALRECLAAVARNWSLAGAAGASVELLLSLRSE